MLGWKFQSTGELKSIRVEHDNAGLGAGWLLDSVEIRNPQSGVTYHFPCKQWFDATKGDKKIQRDIPVKH